MGEQPKHIYGHGGVRLDYLPSIGASCQVRWGDEHWRDAMLIDSSNAKKTAIVLIQDEQANGRTLRRVNQHCIKGAN